MPLAFAPWSDAGVLCAALAPAPYLLVALFASLPARARTAAGLSEVAALCTLALALGADLALAGRVRLGAPAALEAPSGWIRLDGVSAPMLTLVSVIGWIVTRYARVYLEGSPRRAVFTSRLAATLAAVTLLVTSGHLLGLAFAWAAASLGLHRLLLLHPERPGARRAARKKFLTARAGDFALALAVAALVLAYGSFDIGATDAAARAGRGGLLAALAAGALALAAALKSAQAPLHGWLTEVMETPTPVSALLHAGIVNAGGYLLVRLADVMLLAPPVLAALVIVGGCTALFASLVMLTQPAVKTALAWSTIAQMGFMVFECGLGLFSLALLHILAHSLYKAYAFLASGSAVEEVAAAARPGPVAVPGAGAVARAFATALGLYAVCGLLFGFLHKPPQAVALGAILIFGVAYMLAQGFADRAPAALARRTTVFAVATTLGYFLLQSAAAALTAGAVPPPPTPGPLQWELILLAVATFGVAAVVQAMFPLWARHPAAAGLRVHLSNGFYLNALFDRATGGWRLPLAPDRIAAR